MTDKKKLRAIYKTKRAALTDENMEALSVNIADRFFEYLRSIQVNCIHIFLPIHSQREVNTWNIVKQIWSEYPRIKIVVPVVAKDNNTMICTEINSKSDFSIDSYGIPNPTIITPTAPSKIDLILTPLLCIDKKGNRIGYGMGFYDRFFSDCRNDTIKIGLSLFEPLSETIPVDPHDVALDGWITPTKIHLLA